MNSNLDVKKWITEAIDDDCISYCEHLAQDMVGNKVSSSFLRNIFGEMCRIEAGGFEKHRTDFVLLRPRLAYACGRLIGRNDSAKEVIDELQEFYKQCAKEVENAQHFKNLVSIMEAIIAFRKAVGNDK